MSDEAKPTRFAISGEKANTLVALAHAIAPDIPGPTLMLALAIAVVDAAYGPAFAEMPDAEQKAELVALTAKIGNFAALEIQANPVFETRRARGRELMEIAVLESKVVGMKEAQA